MDKKLIFYPIFPQVLSVFSYFKLSKIIWSDSSLIHGDGVELLEAGECLRAEGLVDLELVDVGEGLSGLGHHGADGGHGADAHDLGVTPGDAVPDDSEDRDGIFL